MFFFLFFLTMHNLYDNYTTGVAYTLNFGADLAISSTSSGIMSATGSPSVRAKLNCWIRVATDRNNCARISCSPKHILRPVKNI